MSRLAPDSEVSLHDLLNAQTGNIGWPELSRHFARGAVVVVGPGQDLIAVARCLVEDRERQIAKWFETGQIRRAQDNDARRWQTADSEFWAVVVAPWVLVQEKLDHPDDSGSGRQ